MVMADEPQSPWGVGGLKTFVTSEVVLSMASQPLTQQMKWLKHKGKKSKIFIQSLFPIFKIHNNPQHNACMVNL